MLSCVESPHLPRTQAPSPAEKWGESLEELITCPMTSYVWFCVVLIIDILPTLYVLSVLCVVLKITVNQPFSADL